MSEERFWNTDEYASTAKFAVLDGAMTMRQAGRIFRLEPAPPKVEDINDYIISAVREKDMNYFTYFLHHYESRLNKRVYRFLLTEGIDRNDPLRFLDYKLSCVLVMLECLQNYVPDKGADFLPYAHHFIGNALLDCRRQEEAGSFKSLDEYKAARGIAWLYNNSGKSAKEVIAEYAAEQNCTEETAAEYLTLARQNRRRVPFYSTMQDEDSEETGEDVTCDDSWNYADILWNGIRAKEVQAAFDKLSYKEQDFLERRNAICMNCGRVMPWDERISFEKLSTDYEYSSTSGAERFYKRVVEKMTGLLLDAGVLGVVELKLTDKNKKTAAAAYEYKAVHRYANDDDEWGEIRFDFSVRTAQIVKLADGDLSRSNVFAKIAIRQILTLSVSELIAAAGFYIPLAPPVGTENLFSENTKPMQRPCH